MLARVGRAHYYQNTSELKIMGLKTSIVLKLLYVSGDVTVHTGGGGDISSQLFRSGSIDSIAMDPVIHPSNSRSHKASGDSFNINNILSKVTWFLTSYLL